MMWKIIGKEDKIHVAQMEQFVMQHACGHFMQLPRWAAVFNPLTATLVLNGLPLLLPSSPFMNALNMASMGLGSVMTFGGILILLYRGGTP